MEQALGLKELCEKNLSAGLRLVASLTAYVPVEVFLYLAFAGAVLHVFLLMYALYALARCLTRRARTRYAAANHPRVPTVSPAPERSAGSPVVAPAPSPATTSPKAAAPERPALPAPAAPTPHLGVLAFYRPNPLTPPATPRARALRPRPTARDASPST